jgi:hypothetical protein
MLAICPSELMPRSDRPARRTGPVMVWFRDDLRVHPS